MKDFRNSLKLRREGVSAPLQTSNKPFISSCLGRLYAYSYAMYSGIKPPFSIEVEYIDDDMTDESHS